MLRQIFLFAILTAGATIATTAFELKSNDRVVFLGNSFFEQALDYGHVETALTLAWPGRKITFRNLGWDGDTVFGHSRAGGRRRAVFGDPAEGFARMTEHIQSLDPTVVFVAYGFNESFDGSEGVAAFREGLETLLKAIGESHRQIVLLSPPPMELANPDHVKQHNAILAQYRDVLAEVATDNGHAFADLFSALTGKRYSTNGIHPSDKGYRMIAGIIAKQLSVPSPKIPLISEDAEAIREAIIKRTGFTSTAGGRGMMHSYTANARTSKRSPRRSRRSSSPSLRHRKHTFVN